jgi:hypothetical protein
VELYDLAGLNPGAVDGLTIGGHTGPELLSGQHLGSFWKGLRHKAEFYRMDDVDFR